MAKRKKKNKTQFKCVIVTQQEEKQFFLCYDHEKGEISFCKDFEDNVSVFRTMSDAKDFIKHFGKQINMILTPLEIPLTDMEDSSAVSHILDNISPDELNKLIGDERADDKHELVGN